MSTHISEEWMDQNRKAQGLTVLCPRCLNKEWACSRCNGWGYLTPADAACDHKWKEISQKEARDAGIYHAGMCYHVYQCVHCGTTKSQDSSG